MDPIERYNLESPSAEKAISVYTKLLDGKKAVALWDGACDACGFSTNTDDLEELETVFRHLSKQKGTVGVYGMSLVVRLMTYKNLLTISS